MLADGSNSNRENIYPSGPQGYNDPSIQELPHLILLEKKSSAALDPQSCSNTQLKLVDKAHEDSVLEEARIIEVVPSYYLLKIPHLFLQKAFKRTDIVWLAG
jgi:hypothetical protein